MGSSVPVSLLSAMGPAREGRLCTVPAWFMVSQLGPSLTHTRYTREPVVCPHRHPWPDTQSLSAVQ